jgi:hypothetical protein
MYPYNSHTAQNDTVILRVSLPIKKVISFTIKKLILLVTYATRQTKENKLRRKALNKSRRTEKGWVERKTNNNFEAA